jgi:hypothetical protein
VYRADLSRTLALVVALPSAGATSGAFARESRAADSRHQDRPVVRAPHLTGRLLHERSAPPRGICLDPKPFEVAMTLVCDKIHDPTAAYLVDNIRNLQ